MLSSAVIIILFNKYVCFIYRAYIVLPNLHKSSQKQQTIYKSKLITLLDAYELKMNAFLSCYFSVIENYKQSII